MTTYLLHGGETKAVNEQNDRFFRAFSELPENNSVAILLCYFSRRPDEWSGLTKRDSGYIRRVSGKNIDFHTALNPSDLLTRVKEADVLYVAGGDAEYIEPLYPQLGSLREELDGKIYAGSSMGAFMASARYVLSFDTQKEDEVRQGLGLVPLQILCHWNQEKHRQEKLKLLSADSHVPIILLEDHQFVCCRY